MKREWVPGQFVIGLLDGNEIAGIVRGGGRHMFYADSVTTDQVALKHVHNLRPLAVIDPEDREQVERLALAIYKIQQGILGPVAADLQAALREFANPTPPKPEEPLGLGAVVEDASQVEFIHLGSGLWVYGTTDGPSKGFAYADIPAVKVLSDGVTP